MKRPAFGDAPLTAEEQLIASEEESAVVEVDFGTLTDLAKRIRLALHIHCSTKTIGRLLSREQDPLPLQRSDGKWVMKPREVEAWIERNAQSVRPQSFVYFIEAKVANAIKIGVSTDVERRLENLRSASPVPLTLLHVIEGSYLEEKDLHERFSHLRFNREWFKASPEIYEFIEEHRRSRQ